MLKTSTKWFQLVRKLDASKRNMTSTEVQTALRPFYFAVHPDLFGQFPNQRAINENSLKQLSSFLETIQRKQTPTPCHIKFYIREKDRKQDNFQLVSLHLIEREAHEVVVKILKSCQLSTEFVDKIPKPEPRKDFTKIHNKGVSYGFTHYNEESDFDPIIMRQKVKEAQEALVLNKWLDSNYEEALVKTGSMKPVELEVEKLKKQLSQEWGLMDIRWDCGWNVTHFRGCLQSFSALVHQHPENMHILRGRLLVFAGFTGVSLDGHIMLNSGEVRHNWLDLIKNVRKYDAHLIRIPAFEKSVSQVLKDIKVVRRKFMPKILAGEYERHLQQLTTSISDYLTYKKFPKEWPNSLQAFEIVVETEAGPLMVSPTGQFIVPSSCPGFLLVSFLTENLKDASERMENYKRNKHVEKTLLRQVVAELQLDKLRKDDNVNPDFMIECCQKLLLNKNKLTNFKGVNLNIATYYSVLSDGVICIPWNWKI